MSVRQRRPDADLTMVIVVDDDPYIALPNSTVRDPDLSLQAVGLLAYIRSVDGDTWRLNGIRGIRRHRGGHGTGDDWQPGRALIGRDRIAAAIRELRQVGYCRVTQVRDDDGRMVRTNYEFRVRRGKPDPAVAGRAPRPRRPRPGNPDAARPPLRIKNPESGLSERSPNPQTDNRVAHATDDAQEAAAMAALTRRTGELALVIGEDDGATTRWLVQLVRQKSSAVEVRDGLWRALPRIESGTAGGTAAKNRAYLESSALGRGQRVRGRWRR